MTRIFPRTFLPILALLLASLVQPVQAQPANGNGAPTATAQPTPSAATQPEVKPDLNGNPVESKLDTPDESAKAVAPAAPTLSDLGRSLRNYFTEDELSLLFQYMKESVIASFKGEEVSLPPDIAFKLEILLVRLKKEGGHYMDNLINQLEKDLKNSLKEKLTPPPPKDQPYNPWISKPWE